MLMGLLLGEERDNVNTALTSPVSDSTTEMSLIDSDGGGSLSRIVNTALFRVPRIAPPVGLVNCRLTVSSYSSIESSRSGTMTVFGPLSPGPKLTVSLVAT